MQFLLMQAPKPMDKDPIMWMQTEDNGRAQDIFLLLLLLVFEPSSSHQQSYATKVGTDPDNVSHREEAITITFCLLG
ncbi:hypothetical protein CKAN_00476300 [Cinnamomum micranthum f. kanehirae]|uniref:Uncharacterized protein n=1 Tax=Cinnamomum micranthum f. kanehirae TaxID=337451 RepID=A0A3S3MWS3_9MAGN|nr:hypothetical protein CKAN_00476300 [Cinnamomum micranthum f. kanehirae]